MSSEQNLEEKKVRILIKLRNYKLLKREELKNALSFLVKSKDGTNAVMWAISTQGAVGVAYINQMSKAMEEADIKNGIVVTNGRYTQAARNKAKKNGIELIPQIFPSFNIFDHEFVPKHELMSEEEKEELLAKYKTKPYQFPRINASDPAAKAIGARIGDIVKITRKSQTAGKYVAYRYVVDD